MYILNSLVFSYSYICKNYTFFQKLHCRKKLFPVNNSIFYPKEPTVFSDFDAKDFIMSLGTLGGKHLSSSPNINIYFGCKNVHET